MLSLLLHTGKRERETGRLGTIAIGFCIYCCYCCCIFFYVVLCARFRNRETRSGKSISKSATSSPAAKVAVTAAPVESTRARERVVNCELHSQTNTHIHTYIAETCTHSLSKSCLHTHTMPAIYDNEKQFCIFKVFVLLFFLFLFVLFVALTHTKHTRAGAHTCTCMRQLQGWTAAATAVAATSAASVAYVPLQMLHTHSPIPYGAEPLSIHSTHTHTCTERRTERARAPSQKREHTNTFWARHKNWLFSRRAADDVTGVFLCVCKRVSERVTHTQLCINTDARRRWKSLGFR